LPRAAIGNSSKLLRCEVGRYFEKFLRFVLYLLL